MKSIIEEAIKRSENENQDKRNPQNDEELEKVLSGLKTGDGDIYLGYPDLIVF